jgi:hypothetical protein
MLLIPIPGVSFCPADASRAHRANTGAGAVATNSSSTYTFTAVSIMTSLSVWLYTSTYLRTRFTFPE